MSIDEMQSEINRLTREKQDAERRLAEQRRRSVMAAGEAFERAKGVHVSLSDDYASLTVDRYGASYDRAPGDLNFYYGYEKTVCATHGNDCRGWCDDSEWAFVVTDNGKETMRVGKSGLHPEDREVQEGLLCGIGLWISEMRKRAPASTPPTEED